MTPEGVGGWPLYTALADHFLMVVEANLGPSVIRERTSAW